MGRLLNSLVLLDDGCKEDIIVFDVVVPSVVVKTTFEDSLVEALGEDVNAVVVIVVVVVASVVVVVVNFAVQEGFVELLEEVVNTVFAVEDVVEAAVEAVVVVVVDNSFWTDSI